MTKWFDIKTAPKSGVFLTKENHGIFGGGWAWCKTIRVRDKFFNADTKELVDPEYWSPVSL